MQKEGALKNHISYMLTNRNRLFNPYLLIGTFTMNKIPFVDILRAEPAILISKTYNFLLIFYLSLRLLEVLKIKMFVLLRTKDHNFSFIKVNSRMP